MEIKAKLMGSYLDFASRKLQIQLEAEQDVRAGLAEMGDKPLRVRIVRWKEKRSLDSNAYYWQLLTKLAGKLKTSVPELHNIFLRRKGQPEIIDGQMIYLVIPDTEEAEKRALSEETYHMKPTSEVHLGKDGKLYRTYYMLRGSHTYDTAEMSQLIEELVSECKEQGIETLPPEEVERMMEQYGKEIKKRVHE